MRIFNVFICGIVAFSPAVVQADDLDDLLSMDMAQLSDVKISSSGFFDRDSRLLPGTNFQIDIADSEEYGSARTLGDLLDDQAVGMTISRHERHGGLIGVRGLMIDNNAKTPVLLDGQLISQRMHFGYTGGLESPLIGDLSTAEVSLSANAIVMGGGAINGYINLIPKNGTDFEGGFVSYEHGFKNKLNSAESGYGYVFAPGRDVYLYAGVVSAEGYTPQNSWGYNEPFGANLSRGKVDGFGDTGYRLAAYWRYDDFSLNMTIDRISPFTGTVDTAAIESKYYNRTMATIRPKYTHHLSENRSVELQLSAEVFDYGFVDRNAFSYFTDKSDQGGSEGHIEGKMIYRDTSFDDHQFAIGAVAGRRDFNDSKRFMGGDSTLLLEAVDFEWKELGFFVEDVWSITDKLHLTAGLRYDVVYYSGIDMTSFDEEDHLSPKLAIAYEVDDTLTIGASYQHGFRYPDAFYHSWKPTWDAVSQGAGVDIHSETVDNYEITLQKEFTEHRLKVDVSGFYNEYKDALFFDFFQPGEYGIPLQNWIEVKEADGAVYDPSTGLFDETNGPASYFGAFVNGEQPFQIIGGEIRGDWNPAEDWHVKLGYGYSHMINEPSAEQKRYAKHFVKGNIRKYFMDKTLALDLNGMFNSDFDVVDYNRDPVFAHSRFILDAALTYHVTDRFTVRAVGENLLLENTPSVSNQPNILGKGVLGEDERLFYLQAKVTF